jgi:RecA/RadA recombinase
MGLYRKQVTILVGHFGSGKTEIALNGVLELAAGGERVTLADLDVVKPYFRSRAARDILAEAGVELLAPTGANVHADLPIIVPQIRSHLRQSDRRLIMDVGGDEGGARVLGSLSDVVPVDDTDCWLILNFRRPSTPDPDRALKMIREIEAVGRLPVAGLISNTHLMDETTPAIVLDGYRQAMATAELAEVPVIAVTVTEDLAADLRNESIECPVVPMRRIVKPPFAQSLERRTIGPLFVVN